MLTAICSNVVLILALSFLSATSVASSGAGELAIVIALCGIAVVCVVEALKAVLGFFGAVKP